MQLPEIPVGVETEQNELDSDRLNSLVFNNVTAEGDWQLDMMATSDQIPDNPDNKYANRTTRIGEADFFTSLYTGDSTRFAISASGRYVPFIANAKNPSNYYAFKLLIYDRQTDSITPLVSVGGGLTYYGGLSDPSVSASGRYVAFRSYSFTRISAGRGATTTDILVYDRDTNSTISVFSRSSFRPYPSTSPDPATAFTPLISASGQYVVYESRDIFVYDLQTKTTSLVSVGLEGTQANGSSKLPSISASGQYVVFSSDASNLVANDTNNTSDIFVYDQPTGITQRISVSSDGIEANSNSSAPSISSDGRYVAFSSNASNLVTNDTNNRSDIFIYDRHTGIAQRISVSSDGTEANNGSFSPSISQDGRYVAFSSDASNLVADDTNNRSDIFIYDRHTGITSRVSVSLEGTQANVSSSSPSISVDGSSVAYVFGGSIFVYNLLPNVINGTAEQDTLIGTFGNDQITGFGGADLLTGSGGSDEFIYTNIQDRWDTITDFQPGIDKIVLTQLFNSLNLNYLDYSTASTQGYLRFETFGKDTTILIDPDGRNGSALFTPIVTVSGVRAATLISSLVFPVATEATANQVFSRTSRVSVTSNSIEANSSSSNPSISTSGRYIVFESSASNLVVGDTNNNTDIFVYDQNTGITSRVSVSSDNIQANSRSSNSSISADGRYVVFESSASNLVAEDTNGGSDIFVHDQDTGITSRVSVTSDSIQANGSSSNSSISADGRYVVFESSASNLVADDTNGRSDIFVHDQDTGITSRLSITSNGIQANNSSSNPSLSADGRYVVFESSASNLVADDTNFSSDIFVHDRDTGITNRVSINSNGIQANASSSNPSLSTDARYVVFQSSARLVADDTNNNTDIFVHDRDTGITSRASISSDGIQANGDSSNPLISSDGRYVVFESFASNLVTNDTNNTTDIFVHDRLTSTTSRVSIGTGGIEGNNRSSNPSISVNGNYVAFVSSASNLVVNDRSSFSDIFVYNFLPNVINGTQSQDTLVGTFGDDRITGFGGADILTGGAGSDEFIYTDIQDAGDTITNFQPGIDKIVLTQLFNSLNLNNLDFGTASTQGYLGFAYRNNDTTILLDLDGDADTASPIPLVTVSGISVRTLNNPSNFVI